MKSLNRTLSLVLVLAMCFGLFGVASAATTSSFTDASSVQYTEAVGVMTGIGAINGYTDGSFKPTGSVTREEAAKMITYAVLGESVASKLSVASTGFTDVASDRWSAPYIAYLVNQGVINGMGDGTFAPTANVTAYQIAKMMLCAAGYGKVGEFTGTGWELSVAVKGNTTGIFSGVDNVDYSKAATREEAAQYIFNGITKVPMVTYSKLTESYSTVENKTSSDAAVKDDDIMQIAESVYGTQLQKTDSTKDGVIGHKWTYKGSTIVSFASDVTTLATDKTGTAYSKLTSNTNSAYIGYAADTDPAVSYYYNGAAITAVYSTNTATTTADLAVGDTVFVTGDNKLYTVATAITSGDALNPGTNVTATVDAPQISGLKGIVTTFSDTDSDSKYDVVSFTKDAVYQLTADPTTKTSGEVTYVTISGLFSSVNVKYVSGYEDLKEDDVVLSHSYVSNGNTYYVLTKCASITGTLNAYNTSARVALIDGKQYKVSELASVDLATNADNYLGSAGSTFYLDECGFICFSETESTTTAADNTAFVLETNIDGTVSSLETPVAALLMSDGSVVKATISKLAGSSISASSTVTPETFYTFVKNTDGTYNLTNAADANEVLGGTYSSGSAFTKGVAKFFTKGDGTVNSVLGTASTVFVVGSVDGASYSAYTGVANVPNVTADSDTVAAVLKDSNGYALFAVVINPASINNASSSYSYIFAGTPATTVYDAAGNYDMYTSAIVDGTVGSATATLNNATVLPGVLQAITAKDGSKIATATSTSGMIMAPVSGITGFAINGSTITTTGVSSAFIASSSAKYFLYDITDPTAPTLKAVTADDIAALSGDTYMIQGLKASDSDPTLTQVYVTAYTPGVGVAASATVTATGDGSYITASTTAVPVNATTTISGTANAGATIAYTVTGTVSGLNVNGVSYTSAAALTTPNSTSHTIGYWAVGLGVYPIYYTHTVTITLS